MPKAGLVRAIGRWSLTALVVNSIIGSGVFGVTSLITRLVGTAAPWAFVFAALGTGIVMACFAEVASRFTETGGIYLYTRTAFGQMTGIVMAWFGWLVRLVSAAAAANLFVNYLAELWPQATNPLPRLIILTVLVGILTAVNYCGVRGGVSLSNVFTVAKLVPLGLFIGVGFYYLGEHRQPLAMSAPTGGLGSWLQAVLLLMFTYGGYEAALMPGGETKDPRRDTPRALFVALTVCALIYTSVQLVITSIPLDTAPSDRPLAAAARLFLGSGGAVFITVGALLSVYGYLSANILAVPRLTFALAERGDFPSVLGKVHARFHTPHVSIVLFSFFLWLFSWWGSFQWNLTLGAVTRLVYYGSICAALPVLRRKAVPEAQFRLKAGNVFAVLGVGTSALLLTRVDRSGVIVVAVVVILAIANGLWARRRIHSAATPR